MAEEKSQRWLVTGASRGIGKAIAEAALARGCRVAMLARTESACDEHGPRALSLRGDVTNHQSMGDVAAQVGKAWGGIDVLVNNAGLHRGGLVDRINLEDFDAVLRTNLSGPLNTVRALLPHFGEGGGAIVNIGAVVGFRGFAGDVAYGSSKMGLAGMTQVLAVELARRAIRVNLVIPGFVSTEMTAEISAKAREQMDQKIPLGRQGTPEEIAEVVWWVAQSTYMTGSTVATDGGLMCGL
ncbi:SDR family NAD(P)-dependent oxidoreductase [Allopontixanthobacter sediminis]|uniref:SDR family oxidoreductase n=1 Tax=Allopontixanthobacter sediminis TaxID=1689985 RepID=A0A845B7D6_9SPHN|nr:SDR family oxidoreductase [Allopontixanthobacter sediminis]MXP45347.1 SDR family oxidoreductase [Allopontixanthobacter sediminis]